MDRRLSVISRQGTAFSLTPSAFFTAAASGMSCVLHIGI
jgi:hypothetical protein